MMYQVKVKYTQKGGNEKCEAYMIEAISLTDIETKITKEFLFLNDIQFLSIKREKGEMICDDVVDYIDDKFFKVEYQIVTIDEVTAKETKQKAVVYFNGKDVDEIREKFESYSAQFVSDTEIVTIKQTPIVDYIKK